MKKFHEYTEAKSIIEDAENYLSEKDHEDAFNCDITFGELVNMLFDHDYQYEFSCYYNDLLGNLNFYHLEYIKDNFGEGLTADNVMYINEALFGEILDMYGEYKLSEFN